MDVSTIFLFFGYDLFVITKERMRKMEKKKTIFWWKGLLWLIAFGFFTILVQIIDVQALGVQNSNIGFATINLWIHHLFGVNLDLYIISDWLSLIVIALCLVFAMIGLLQFIQRKSLRKVDHDIILLGVYYAIVMFVYVGFETVVINYRPILIDGRMEISYPSSTTLLVLSVMLSVIFQIKRRIKSNKLKTILLVLSWIFMISMVVFRFISGVHWFSDIVGSILFSIGLYQCYESLVMLMDQNR